MVTGMVVAAGAADPARGWGNIWGLLAGMLASYGIWRYDKWRQARRRNGDDSPSPTPMELPGSRETPQVTRVSSHSSHGETADGEGPWYGRIVKHGGHFYRTTKHIAKTGESPKPEAYNPPSGEPEIDVPLDDEADDVPDESTFVPVNPPRFRESREQYVTRCLRAGVAAATVVAGLREHYDVPRATAYRIVSKAQQRGRPAA